MTMMMVKQTFSQDLKTRHSKWGNIRKIKQFCLKSGHPQDNCTPIGLKACYDGILLVSSSWFVHVLKILEIGFWSLKVVEFVSIKIEKVSTLISFKLNESQ